MIFHWVVFDKDHFGRIMIASQYKIDCFLPTIQINIHNLNG